MELSKEQVAYLNSLDSKKKKRKFILDCLVEKFSGASLGESDKIEKPTLEVGKWYTFKNNPSNWWLGCISDKNLTYYGFNEGRWFNQNKFGLINTNYDDYKLATPQEVETAFKKLMIEKGFTNGRKVKSLWKDKIVTLDLGFKTEFNIEKNEFWMGGYCLFKDGKFAEIIDEKTTDSSSKLNYSPEEIDLVKHNMNQREISEQGSELLKFDMVKKEKDIFIEIYNLGKKDQKEINKTALNYQKRRENYLLGKFVAKYINQSAK